jgi:hypothetical protein
MASQNKRMAVVWAGLVVCNVLVAATTQALDVSFTRRDFDAGSIPTSVAVGDFNGDGVRDLAVANWSNNVSVLLGNGDGTFQAPQNFATAGNPSSVAVGDFNGDGRPDLAVANSSSNNVSVLLGNGDGSFQAAQNFAAGSTPVSTAVGDFNGDGWPDLAVANQDSNNVSVLLGDGDGTFQAPRNFGAGIVPRSVAVGDGWQDLAVANNGELVCVQWDPKHEVCWWYEQRGSTVSVLLGNGDGSFQTARNFAVPPGSYPASVAVGDFNGDGRPDLAVANFGFFPDQGTVSVLLGNGDGSFQTARNFAVGIFPLSVAVGDFNGDGMQDLAVANSNSNNASVLLGNGDGTFQGAQNFAVGSYPASVAVGDFNGDAWADLAVANSGSSTVSVLINNTPQ